MKAPEIVDAVEWDGLKETALAFFGMDVLEESSECPFYLNDELDLFEKKFCNCPECDYNAGHPVERVDLYLWLLRNENGDIWTMTDEQFNNEYDIIDEYPA